MKSKALCVMAVVVAALVGVSAFAGQAGKVDISGKWLFNVETAAGSGTPSITLKQDGDKLTGHYSGSSAKPTSPARSPAPSSPSSSASTRRATSSITRTRARSTARMH